MLEFAKQNMIFAYVILLTLKISLKLGMKWRLVIILTINLVLNGEKLSTQFPKFGRKFL